jgi:hypothetical protein
MEVSHVTVKGVACDGGVDLIRWAPRSGPRHFWRKQGAALMDKNWSLLDKAPERLVAMMEITVFSPALMTVRRIQ